VPALGVLSAERTAKDHGCLDQVGGLPAACAKSHDSGAAAPSRATGAGQLGHAVDDQSFPEEGRPPPYENGLISACVNNKIAPTKSMCNCIVASLQSHHPALAESSADRKVVQQWMGTASGDPFSLHEYALNCGR
jgi:hypothetical protein